MTEPKLYPTDLMPWDLEPHYSRHVSAMTAEALHAKGEIATQLAWRDKRIAELEAQANQSARDRWAGYQPPPLPEQGRIDAAIARLVTPDEDRAGRLLRFWHRKRTGGNRCPGSGGREFMKATGRYGCRRAVLRDGTGLCGKCSGRDERLYAGRP